MSTRAPVPAGRNPVVLLRHASAGDRESWRGPDEDRPLDATGHRQAAALVGLLAAYDISRIHSSDFLRCRQTVAPLAAATHLEVDVEPLLGERAGLLDLAAATRRWRELVTRGGPAVLCTQRKVLDAVLPAVLAQLDGRGLDPDPADAPDKGGLIVLHVAADGRIHAVEEVDPPG